MNVSQWILSIGTFPLLLPVSTHLQIDPNESVTLHLTRGDDTDEDVYLGQAPDALINSMQPGTSLVLLNRQAELTAFRPCVALERRAVALDVAPGERDPRDEMVQHELVQDDDAGAALE